MNNENNNLNNEQFNNMGQGMPIGNVNGTPNPNSNKVETLNSISPEIISNNQSLNNPSGEVNQGGTFFNSPMPNQETTQSNTNQTISQAPNMGSSLNNDMNQNMGVANPNPVNNNWNNQTPPNYTNPQSINPNPMPGFENPGAIGQTPPISLEKEKKPQKKVNKTLFIVIIIVVLFGIGCGVYYILNYTNLLKQSNQGITVTAKDLELKIGDKLPQEISEYAEIKGTDAKNCSIDVLNVDVSKIGKYEYTVTCGETKGTGNITIKEDETLKVTTKTVYVAKNGTIDAKDFINEVTDNMNVKFVDEAIVKTNLQTPNSYEVSIKVTDASNRETTVVGKLVVLEHEIGGYVTCSSKSQNVSNTSAKMIITEKFALANTSTFDFAGVTTEEHKFTFTDETEYTSLMARYRIENKLTINEITSENVTFDDETKTITFITEREKDDVIKSYGESQMKNYGTIFAHFRDRLGYSCIYSAK